jgi:hypothetical protein
MSTISDSESLVLSGDGNAFLDTQLTCAECLYMVMLVVRRIWHVGSSS